MEGIVFDKKTAKFCGMVEEYRLELAKKKWIDLKFDVSLDWYVMLWIHEVVLISKKFWFIEWLWLNNKINFVKLDDDCNWYELNTGNEYLDLVALISIQDNPIEFLISILK